MSEAVSGRLSGCVVVGPMCYAVGLELVSERRFAERDAKWVLRSGEGMERRAGRSTARRCGRGVRHARKSGLARCAPSLHAACVRACAKRVCVCDRL